MPTEQFQVTTEEERFLRAFVRRQVRPWFALGLAATLAVGLAATGALLSLARRPTAPAPSPRIDAAPVAELEAGIAELRAEGETARGELVALRESLETASKAPTRELGGFENRLTGALRSIKALEKRVAEISAARAAPGATPPELASSEVNAILQRLYNVELRQGDFDEAREGFERSVLDRLVKVESRRDDQETVQTESQRTLLERLDLLEQRFHHLEKANLAARPEPEATPPAALP